MSIRVIRVQEYEGCRGYRRCKGYREYKRYKGGYKGIRGYATHNSLDPTLAFLGVAP